MGHGKRTVHIFGHRSKDAMAAIHSPSVGYIKCDVPSVVAMSLTFIVF